MAILKNHFGVSRFDGEFSLGSKDSLSSDEDELQRRSSVSEDSDDEDDDADSGAGSDDFDMSELGEIGAEFCQVGNQNCTLPLELYDLPNMGEVLTVDTWNDFLTEEERFSLAQFLPDMDHETFMRTLKELFSGRNFHFGSPLVKLFDMLKGGLCEPRVACYMQGLNFLQKHQHHHVLRKYQNSMVNSLIQIKDAWQNCKGYSIEQRLQVLNIMRNQRSLMNEKMEYFLGSDSSEREESGEGFWSKKLKDTKVGSKVGNYRALYRTPTLDVPSHGRRPMAVDVPKYGKKNPKGILKLSGSKVSSVKDVVGRFLSIQHATEMKSRSYGSTLALPKEDRMLGYDSGVTLYKRGGEIDEEGPTYKIGLQRDHNAKRGTTMARVGLLKPGRKHESLKSDDDFTTDSFMDLPRPVKNESHSYGRNRDVKTVKDRAQHLSIKGNQVDWSSGSHHHHKTQEVAFPANHPTKFDDWNIKSKKLKMVQGFQTSKSIVASDAKVGSYKPFPTQMNGSLLPAELRGKTLQGKIRGMSAQNGGVNMEKRNMFAQSEETESDSSEDVVEEEDIKPLRNKQGYSKAVLDRRPASMKSMSGLHKAKVLGKIKKEHTSSLDGVSYSSKDSHDLGERFHMSEVKIHSSKGKQKGSMHHSSHLHGYAGGVSEKGFVSGSTKLGGDDRKETYKFDKNGQTSEEAGGRLHSPLLMAYPAERKHRGKADNDYPVSQSKYMDEYFGEEDEDLQETNRSVNDHGLTNKLGKKYQDSDAFVNDRHERSNLSLLGCNSTAKKRKGKADVTYKDGPGESDYPHSSTQQQIDELTPLKKRGKRKVEAETSSLAVTTSEPLVLERGVTDAEPEAKSLKKPFTLITPTVHTGFSFSIIHLLSAVRMAMITPNAEDGVGERLQKSDGRQKHNTGDHGREYEGADRIYSHENLDVDSSDHTREKNLLSLTVQEIVNRVTSNPGDPCILETQEPLQDLVRGVLKIFSSKTAPLGAKGWKTLVVYEKSSKSWCWIGPVPSSLSDNENIEEETSAAAWGLPHKMLVKLVDSFANWLKNGQETLQQIGSLPAPPVTLMQPYLDEKERFRDLRAQKSLTTISPSSEEVRSYFRKEEFLRYSVPDRAFQYTAADGRKSIVAPLRRCGGKPTSKARDHFMLKPDRPPHVTILCLVRDAAARLPGSIGTRADVCTLIRDSQYIVEDVSDAQINQVVSGALDRLHYERDPCVQFDGDRKLWVYLHREREEEDFEDDGTSSTKKWKRQRKEAIEQSDQGNVNVAYHGTGEPNADGSAGGYDLSSDLNAEPLCMHEEKMSELAYNDLRQNVDGNIEPCLGLEPGSIHQGHPMGWEVLGLNHMRENKMICQENSSNGDFGDETFSRERPVGLLSASLL